MDWKDWMGLAAFIFSGFALWFSHRADRRSQRQEDKGWKIVLQKFKSYRSCIAGILESLRNGDFAGDRYYAYTQCFVYDAIDGEDRDFLAQFFHGKEEVYQQFMHTAEILKSEYKEKWKDFHVDSRESLDLYTEDCEEHLEALDWAIKQLEAKA